ncbi:MAG: hypothetical protein Q8Q06_00255 [bacterium]|nr:hypothetical protein [bacterium]
MGKDSYDLWSAIAAIGSSVFLGFMMSNIFKSPEIGALSGCAYFLFLSTIRYMGGFLVTLAIEQLRVLLNSDPEP